MNEIKLLLLFVVFLTLLIFLKRTKKSKVSIFISLIWCISSISSYIYYIIYHQYFGYKKLISGIALIYLFCCFIIVLWPFTRLKSIDFRKNYNSTNILFCFAIIIIGLNILPLFYNVLYFISHLSNLSNVGSGYGEHVEVLSGYISTLGRYSRYLRIFVPILLFHFLHYRNNKFIIVGLILSFINPIIGNLNIGSRFDFVVESLYFYCLYLIFSASLNNTVRKRIHIIYGIVILIGGIVFMAITLYRFTDAMNYQDNNPILVSLFSYTGQSFVNFSSYMWGCENYTNGDNCFFIIKYLFGTYDSLYRNGFILSTHSNLPLHLFYTFIGDFYIDFGPIVTCAIICFISIFAKTNIQKINRTYSFCNIVWIALILKIFISGFTYYPFMNNAFEIIYVPLVNVILMFLIKINNTSNSIRYVRNRYS